MNGESSLSRNTVPFCVCGRCQKQWAVWRDFVVDPEVRLLGLQHVPNIPNGNLLVFDHSCGTSVSILAQQLRTFVPDQEDAVPADSPGSISTEECTRLCVDLEHLVACDRPCPRASDRRLAQAIVDLRQETK